MNKREKEAREKLKLVQSRGRTDAGEAHTYKDRGHSKDAAKSVVAKAARAVNKYIEGNGPR